MKTIDKEDNHYPVNNIQTINENEYIHLKKSFCYHIHVFMFSYISYCVYYKSGPFLCADEDSH